MSKNIPVDPIRRHYNQWVNNEMLEDCALRFTAWKARRWSCFAVANTALGAISFLALEAIGAAITLQYGAVNAISAILVVSFIIFVLGVPIAVHAARSGVDIDLLTRGAGFGYLGSTITSLIYAGFTFIYFALEAAIMASALNVCFGVPLSLGYLLCSCVIIPVVIYGITMISTVQRVTQPLWLALQIAPFAFLLWQSISPLPGWQGIGLDQQLVGQEFDLLMFGAASAVVFSLTVQIGEQVDYLRFLPPKTDSNSKSWWVALLSAGPGWIVIGAVKMIAGAYLGVMALQYGIASEDASDPVFMYLNAWSSWLSPELALAVTGIFVLICQFKINITNAYAGSLAWSNFFSRLTHSHPGRVVWLIFNVVIAWMLMELGVYQSLENTLSLYSILAVSWIGAIATDLAVNKKLGISPVGVRFKRAELYDINPVGVCSMGLATAIGLLAYSGIWGDTLQSLAAYLTLIVVVVLMPLFGIITKGKYYLILRPDEVVNFFEYKEIISSDDLAVSHVRDDSCVICGNDYDLEDLISCPAYQGPICSLCCALDTRCEDKCRPDAQFLVQLRNWTIGFLPVRARSRYLTTVFQFFGLVLVSGIVLAFVFGLVYLQSDLAEGRYAMEIPGPVSERLNADLAVFLLNLFAAWFILAAIVTWIFLLTSESANRAREDTARQNELLVKEIEAHEETEKKLNKAKNVAEAANQAKSRYVIGLSHELRTPLNSIQGYAQLMEQEADTTRLVKNGVRVIQDSSQHLAGLIENLLDISKIEAEKLTLNRDHVDLHLFLDQLVKMFQVQATNSGLDFRINLSPFLPRMVYADEKRVRQILINLLSNAFKYTTDGYVELAVDYRNQLTTFQVKDTGVGICKSNLERIFQPFETLSETSTDLHKGTGLGLTISRLLAKIMGGDLAVSSSNGNGSCFTLKLLLPLLEDQSSKLGTRKNFVRKLKYTKRIVVVDDDTNHRKLIADFLEPMGFQVDSYSDAGNFLEKSQHNYYDVYLLDISLPGMNGWKLAEILKREFQSPVRILMVSALADSQIDSHMYDATTENYFVKPVNLHKLIFRIEKILELEWIESNVNSASISANENDNPVLSNDVDNLYHRRIDHNVYESNKINLTAVQPGDKIVNPSTEVLGELRHLSSIGHLKAIYQVLEKTEKNDPQTIDFVASSRELLERHELQAFANFLEVVIESPND